MFNLFFKDHEAQWERNNRLFQYATGKSREDGKVFLNRLHMMSTTTAASAKDILNIVLQAYSMGFLSPEGKMRLRSYGVKMDEIIRPDDLYSMIIAETNEGGKYYYKL